MLLGTGILIGRATVRKPEPIVVTEYVEVAGEVVYVTPPKLEAELKSLQVDVDVLQAKLSAEVETNANIKDHVQYVDEFVVTAYCSCKKCCGVWAENRPKVNGQEVVFTATSAVAQEGVTVAVDPKVIPYGTALYIEGVGIRYAQDCGGGIKGNRLDVYYADHDRAWTSGLNDRPRKVWIVG